MYIRKYPKSRFMTFCLFSWDFHDHILVSPLIPHNINFVERGLNKGEVSEKCISSVEWEVTVIWNIRVWAAVWKKYDFWIFSCKLRSGGSWRYQNVLIHANRWLTRHELRRLYDSHHVGDGNEAYCKSKLLPVCLVYFSFRKCINCL